MIYSIEGVMLFAAVLADLWLGSYGFLPCLAIYVIFHASRSVSLRFATAAVLRERGNDVIVVIGTINPHMQTPASLKRYYALRAAAQEELMRQEYHMIDLPELPSEEYADASHPLAAGYRRLAKFIAEKIPDQPVTQNKEK